VWHRRVPTGFVSKLKGVKKRESAEGQMVTDLISFRNESETISKRPQLTKW
jgi:ribosomal protein S6E (S10)